MTGETEQKENNDFTEMELQILGTIVTKEWVKIKGDADLANVTAGMESILRKINRRLGELAASG